MQITIAAYVAALNIAGFIICIYDKRAAVKSRRRISERALFSVALLGGSLGLYTAMLAARHKTRQRRFMVFIPVIIAVQAGLLMYLFKTI
ncbi:MAG: DUF1294 domain-containing protein [Eubacteriales bacterium]|nr:DUF1294 domain-containing protein [Eubacteriales bacterium]